MKKKANEDFKYLTLDDFRRCNESMKSFFDDYLKEERRKEKTIL